MSPDLRGAAILGADGACSPPAATRDRWREDAAALFAAADRAGDEPAEQIHIATEQGEVFALRHAGLAAVAVTERFALASLLLFDMRALLRDLAAAADGAGVTPPKPHRVLLDRVSGYADEAAAYMRRRRALAPPLRPPLLPGRPRGRPRRRRRGRRRALRRRRAADRGRREANEGLERRS